MTQHLKLGGAVAAAAGWAVLSATSAVAYVEPGLYFDPDTAAVGQHAEVHEVEVGICDSIRFALAPDGATVDGWGDSDLVVVDGTREAAQDGDGITTFKYTFTVPAVIPGRYTGYADCPTDGYGGPTANVLTVTAAIPDTATTPRRTPASGSARDALLAVGAAFGMLFGWRRLAVRR